jgi:hypothetical protein
VITSRRASRLTALALIVTLPVLGQAVVASAKTTKAAPKVCAKHPNRAKCAQGAGGATGGPGGSNPQITVEVDPNPLVETAQSEVHAVVQVETLPAFAGDSVNIDSSQLSASCAVVDFETVATAGKPLTPEISFDGRTDAVLDDDGNATVVITAFDCAPGASVIEADLEVAPFLTALTTLVAQPPVVTPEGLTGYPQTAGVAQEVETGDTSTSGDSNIYAVFYVETNPVYAEQTVEISSAQLESRCIVGWTWVSGDGLEVSGAGPTGIEQHAQVGIDDDGNAVFIFMGQSCASGTSEVIADVLAGSHPTYVTDFTVLPPMPTI